MQLTVVKAIEESINFGDKEVKEIAKRIAAAISKPDTTEIMVRDGDELIMNIKKKHFDLIKELMAI